MYGVLVLGETGRELDGMSPPDEFRPSGGRKLGAVLVIVGLVSMAAVAFAAIAPRLGGQASPAPSHPAGPLTTVVDASTVLTSGPSQISLQSVTYGPGESSGWHLHPGLHLVSILSGTLTVYGADCQPHTFGPGQPYMGGDELHVARNETDAPLEMAVTYVVRPGQAMQHFRIDAVAPANCLVS